MPEFKNLTFNFPYFGAGKAEYFDWAHVEVIFIEIPNQRQKKQIEKKVPLPIAEITWEENFMVAETGQWSHLPDLDNRWFFATSSQVNDFNAATERWLNEIHDISPIFLVLRNENDEAGGTELSDWHTWSLKQFQSILPYFDAIVTDLDYKSAKAGVLLDVFNFTEIDDILKLDNKYLKYFHPGEIEFEAFEKGNIEPLKLITNSDYLDSVIRRFNNRLNECHQKEIEKYAALFLSFEPKISENTFKNLNKILFTHFTDINSETFKTIANKISDLYFIDNFAGKAYQLMRSKKNKESIRLFEKLLLVPVEASIRSGFYTNILWVYQKDNTGLPINKTRNLLALEKCLPKGTEHPAILFNACCIYTEMEEYDNAYEMVEKAIAHHYDKKFMVNEIKNEDMFKDFREKTDILNRLKNDKLEPKENPKPRFIGESFAYGQFNVHAIYNRGYAVNFSSILLINGNVTISGEFNAIYKTLIGESKTIQHANIINGIRITKEKKQEALVIVNGNLTAKSITEDKDVYILVMGKIKCKNITHQEVIEKSNTNFDYIVNKFKNTMNKKETLINQIREAFSNVKLENGIGLNEAQGIGDYADAKTKKKLRAIDEKMHWENIPSSELERCNSSLSFFDAKGMRFHLPSFMIAELKGEYFGIVFHLVNDSDYSKTQFSALSNSQREVIKQFLEYLFEEDNYDYEKNQIKSAIDNYWSV